MLQVVSLLLAIFKAVPQLKDLFDKLMVAYLSYQENKIKEEIKDGIKKAIEQHDQRDLEKAMGSTKAGELSGNPNTTIRPSRPH